MQEAHRINGFYYLQNNAKMGNVNAYKLFTDALADMDAVAVTKVTFRTRQALMVIFPQDGVLAAVTMAFGPDVRVPDQGVRAHIAGQYTEAELDMAKQLLGAMSNAQADPLSAETDAAVAKRHELVSQAMQGKKIDVPDVPEPAATNALGDALKASLAALAEPVTA
jgi:non-homologous end joining protein Ku